MEVQRTWIPPGVGVVMEDQPKDTRDAEEVGWWGEGLGGLSNSCKDPRTSEWSVGKEGFTGEEATGNALTKRMLSHGQR